MAAHALQPPNAECVATALLISSFEYDHRYFQNLFNRTNWQLLQAGTIVAACEILWNYLVPVVVVDEGIEAGGWKGVLENTQPLQHARKIIVMSLLSTDSTWADVFQLGAYDLLARPLEQQEVLHSISMAWLAWKYELERRARPKKQQTAHSHLAATRIAC